MLMVLRAFRMLRIYRATVSVLQGAAKNAYF
jgi:hypothetical protein